MRKRLGCGNQENASHRLFRAGAAGGNSLMPTTLTVLILCISCLALLDLAALAFGADSRETFVDDHRR